MSFPARKASSTAVNRSSVIDDTSGISSVFLLIMIVAGVLVLVLVVVGMVTSGMVVLLSDMIVTLKIIALLFKFEVVVGVLVLSLVKTTVFRIADCVAVNVFGLSIL